MTFHVTGSISISEPVKSTPKVYDFCKDNNIEYGHDWNYDEGLAWTEIYVDDHLVFQVGNNCKQEQFIELVLALEKDFTNKENIDIPGDDFWFSIGSKKVFNAFLKKHGHLFHKV